MRYAGADWVKRDLVRDLSPLGEKVANILGQVYAGIYHLPMSTLLSVGWEDSRNMTLCISGELATFDQRRLTDLVILCHDACVRLAVGPASPSHLRLWFSQREREAPSTMKRHPTMEEALAAARA